MRLDSLAQLYSSKTDDELLALASDQASLVEEARPLLADELRRRNLLAQSIPGSGESAIPLESRLAMVKHYLPRAKWFGLWVLSTFVATFGVAMTVGFFTYSCRPFTSRAVRIALVQTPYYPLPILVGLVVGYFSYLRLRGSYRFWVWILPAALVLKAPVNWRAVNQALWSEAVVHFFGRIPYSDNRDQLESSLPLYMSLAFSLGALVHTTVRNMMGVRKPR